MTERSREADARLARRAAVVIAVQTAAAVAVVIAGVAVLVLVLTIRAQSYDAVRTVQTAASSATDVTAAPVGVTLMIRAASGEVAMSPGAPTALASIDLAQLPLGRSERTIPDAGRGHDGGEFLLYTVDREGGRIVAALDTHYRDGETRRLTTALVTAGLIGVAAAALVGWLIGARAVRPLSAALQLQRRFVADASHELRTPLTILHTRAQMIARRQGLDAGLQQDLERLRADTRGLTDLVNDLLLSAELPHRTDTRRSIDLGALARDVADSLAPAAVQAGVTLTVDVRPDPPTTVAGIPAALRRAVVALVDNSLNHTHPGDSIKLRVDAHAGTVALAVSDTGDGLDPKQGDALTRRFAQGHHSGGRVRRFGLGLALVREIVDTHGGTLTLDGQVGVGATVTIALPRLNRQPDGQSHDGGVEPDPEL